MMFPWISYNYSGLHFFFPIKKRYNACFSWVIHRFYKQLEITYCWIALKLKMTHPWNIFLKMILYKNQSLRRKHEIFIKTGLIP